MIDNIYMRGHRYTALPLTSTCSVICQSYKIIVYQKENRLESEKWDECFITPSVPFAERQKYMRKLIAYIILIFVYLSITACGNNFSMDDIEKYNQTETLPTGEIDVKNIKQLETIDFSITDGEDSITLDSDYNKLKINKSEEKLDNNYVGEIYSGEFVYKVYMHKYTDFDLYVSNSNYNIKNRNFDEYYITQITLKNSTFKTYRNITIGSDVEEIIKAYGYGEELTEEEQNVLIYTLNDMKMQFTIDENYKVQDVVLSIVVKDMH